MTENIYSMTNETINETELIPKVDEQEYQAAMKEAQDSVTVYTHEFLTPFAFEGEAFDKLTFDFDKLTAADSLAIETEMSALGQPVMVLEFSGEYLLRMAMRACTHRKADGSKLGIDAFKSMPLSSYVKIRGKARSFLLRAGS